MPAARIGCTEDALPHAPIQDIRGLFSNCADNLVAGDTNSARRVHAMRSVEDSQIRATYARAQHLHQEFAASDPGNRLHAQVVGAMVDSCKHDGSPRLLLWVQDFPEIHGSLLQE